MYINALAVEIIEILLPNSVKLPTLNCNFPQVQYPDFGTLNLAGSRHIRAR